MTANYESAVYNQEKRLVFYAENWYMKFSFYRSRRICIFLWSERERSSFQCWYKRKRHLYNSIGSGSLGRESKLGESMAKSEYGVVRLLCISALFFTAALLDGVLGGNDSDGSVSYDGRSLIVNGEHKLLFSGSIHYPRSTPDVSLISFRFWYFVMISMVSVC